MEISRPKYLNSVVKSLKTNRVVAILGARQVGKTTLARHISKLYLNSEWFDLEDSRDRARLSDPMLAMRNLTGLIIIDEVQLAPQIFETIRVLADTPKGARFLLLGSASPDLLRHTSETLAGRITHIILEGFSLDEIGLQSWKRLWLRGGFPKSYLASTDIASFKWRHDFIRTFLECDLARVAPAIHHLSIERFWFMLAHWHAQIFNSSELSRSLGVSDTAIRRYLDLLAGTYVLRILKPWHENISKRQVKAPKVFFSDTGLLHSLLGLDHAIDLERHPKIGASWEGFAMQQVIRRIGALNNECFFWASHQGAELDLLVVKGNKRLGFEFKYSDSPVSTKSMHIAMNDLRLDSLNVIYPGEDTYPIAKNMRAIGLTQIWNNLKVLR